MALQLSAISSASSRAQIPASSQAPCAKERYTRQILVHPHTHLPFAIPATLCSTTWFTRRIRSRGGWPCRSLSRDEPCRQPRLEAPALPDPGRAELRHEFSGAGEERLCLPLIGGAMLHVTGHEASEQQILPGMQPGSFQEWRVLRFQKPEVEGESGEENVHMHRRPFIQSVTKVTVPADGSGRAIADSHVLALSYPKSLVTVTVATLAALGVMKSPRILVIGLGAGSVPLWLADHLPNSHIDAVELEPAVVQAAEEAMGFHSKASLKIHVESGVSFAKRVAADPTWERYDAVVIDAYDDSSCVPAEFVDADKSFVKLLPDILKPHSSFVVANLPPGFQISDLVSSYTHSLWGLQSCPGFSFSVPVPSTSNTIAAVTTGWQRPANFKDFRAVLRREAALFARQSRCSFNMVACISCRVEQLMI
eukprot:TRINITY_DN7655_c1_g6_i1.p1 TRINITY_DN7655_c1_g6~~TRINITY_DN7655_c1_g6_i1.p1  ORF type:complete len:423 (+),score=62.61 TRINITY_DN7655_c1_g6_i1:424-1692(+)